MTFLFIGIAGNHKLFHDAASIKFGFLYLLTWDTNTLLRPHHSSWRCQGIMSSLLQEMHAIGIIAKDFWQQTKRNRTILAYWRYRVLLSVVCPKLLLDLLFRSWDICTAVI